MTTTTLTAYLNNTFVKEPCSLCEQWFRVGEIQVVADDRLVASVCDQCTAEHDPELADAIEWLDRETGLSIDRREYPFDDVVRLLVGDDESTIGRFPSTTVEQIRTAAQFIACHRGTCGKSHPGHIESEGTPA